MPLFESPNVSKLAAKGDLKGLIKALGYQRDWLVRRQAVEALKAIGSDRAIEALVGALGDSNSTVRDGPELLNVS
jgi:HEAT repeat protein